MKRKNRLQNTLSGVAMFTEGAGGTSVVTNNKGSRQETPRLDVLSPNNNLYVA